MTNVARFDGNLFVGGTLTAAGGIAPDIARSNLAQTPLASIGIPFYAWKVWNACHTNLSGTAATDDLEVTTGAFGTAPPSIQTGDVKGVSLTSARYARTTVQLPENYDDGESVNFRFRAGMLTTIADVSATLDLEVYELAGDNTVGSDLCTTAAIDINSTTLANRDFVVTATGLVAGDWLDIRIGIIADDAGTGTAVIGCVTQSRLLCDVRG